MQIHDIGWPRRCFALLGLAALVCCTGCSGCTEKSKPDEKVSGLKAELIVPPQPLLSIPPLGTGWTYRGFRVGATVSSDLVVKVEAGIQFGAVGVSVPILIISVKDGTFAFVPDVLAHPEFSVEIGKHHGIKLSAEEGFGREIGVKFPLLRGRLVGDFKTELPKVAGTPSSRLGHMEIKDGVWAFTEVAPVERGGHVNPFLAKPPYAFPSLDKADVATIDPKLLGRRPLAAPTPLLPVPLHRFELTIGGQWIPEMGYTWLDGSLAPRQPFDPLGLAVRWNAGQSCLFPPHVRASRVEGLWEPEPGYRWVGPPGELLRTTNAMLFNAVQWSPFIGSQDHPHVLAALEEGQWMPALGYAWATNPPIDFTVIPAFPPVAPPQLSNPEAVPR